MAKKNPKTAKSKAKDKEVDKADQPAAMQNDENTKLESGTYEIIRSRLHKFGNDLQSRLNTLNGERKTVFGSIDQALLSTERITTENNCQPADMVPVGNLFLFGYNVHLGLKKETLLSDVFSIYDFKERSFHKQSLDLFKDSKFQEDFRNLYKYYKKSTFVKFAEIGPYIFMVFQIGKSVTDIKTFKWLITPEKKLSYEGNRFDHEFVFPDQHEFKWKRTTRDDQVKGAHPHVAIEDKVFVETVGGDLTIKVENNTDSGRGIYEEPVENKSQTLDDSEIYYAIIGNLIVLKIKPYQEDKYRYIVYNSKLQEAVRIDALEDSCVLLPENHGLIFAKGYYLQTGAFKLFESNIEGMFFERKITSPNGEDYLYIFFNKETGTYILLSYNMISQQVENPVICNGFSFFDNGEMCYFRSDNEEKKHHAIQVWQTPYVSGNFEIPVTKDSYLYKIGNKDIVSAMAECTELLTLINKEDSYTNLYVDIVRRATDTLDTYYWLDNKDAQNLKDPLIGIRDSAASAIEEFEKVTKIKKNTKAQVEDVNSKATELLQRISNEIPVTIDNFVGYLSELRILRGEAISLKDLRYVDLPQIETLEKELSEKTEVLSQECVDFLLKDEALEPYEVKVKDIKNSVAGVTKVMEANKIEEIINTVSSELEMLIDIVSNLKIEDSTQTTRILDNISAIYSSFNQINAALKNKRKELLGVEGKAEFNSQIKLISQGVINYLDMCDSVEKTEEYLSKLMVQLEELEGKFPEFDEFIVQITEKREEIYNAFESKKVSLVEARNKRANSLMQSADRILKAIQNRVSRFTTVSEINGYYASDLMVEKLRDTISSLIELGDSVKADDLQSRLKTVRDETIRQLKDKTDLYVEGENIIKFGKHQFSVNTQSLSLTMVNRSGKMYYHLTGTNFFEEVKNEEFNATKEVWDQDIVSENREVYRSEFLAYQIWIAGKTNGMYSKGFELSVSELQKLNKAKLNEYIKKFMSQRYDEGYIKGVNDVDAEAILSELIGLSKVADLLRFPSAARACASFFWNEIAEDDYKLKMGHRLKGVGAILSVFPDTKEFEGIIKDLCESIQLFCESDRLFNPIVVNDAAEYLFHELSRGNSFVADIEAVELHNDFKKHLKKKTSTKKFINSVVALNGDKIAKFKLIRNWVKAFVLESNKSELSIYVDEVATFLFRDNLKTRKVIKISLKKKITGLQGGHSLIEKGEYNLDYNAFMQKMCAYEMHTVKLYDQYTDLKKRLIAEFEEELRLSEFKPRVLTSFVRNKLIDKVYLPLIGSNLAKQIGAAGEGKRTDLMGMLLLISPPGYGKTTLMEYIANRLGLIFMKVNGPAIGHAVTAIDPAEATNAGAREELNKLNLAFEMGDNVMIYLDDIQHCNPEFLQKFISLCDAQRKIEGVYKGRTKTYDFRGKKVCVVMAGNPYTESGDKFQIPDMLANRADIYNLGDIIGDAADEFKLSYIENSLTSNLVLGKLAGKSQKDVYTLINMATHDDKEGHEFEANHSTEDINEYVNILKKVRNVRDVILMVNMEYIRSAAQADEYRTEPPFKLQGSYRNMNRITEKVVSIMNGSEMQTLVNSHYENEAQTLTTGAESNLLKFREMMGLLTEEETARWEEIKELFVRNQRMKGFGAGQQTGLVLEKMDAIANSITNAAKAVMDKK